jgi:hypothetical protein
MRALSRMGAAMAGLLVGLGVAILARTIAEVGVDELAFGHVVGPGLILVGLLRLRLQRALERGNDDPREEGGGDGGAS